jgi:acyl-CoA dehydrogenase
MNTPQTANSLRADQLLVETIDKLFVEHCTPERTGAAEGGMDSVLWNAAYDMGLTSVGISEAAGGSGGSMHDAAAIIRATGYHAAAAPIADTLAAGLIAAANGFVLPEGPFVAAATTRVPWLGVAAHVVTADGVMPTETLTSTSSGANYAGEPYAVISSLTRAAGAEDLLALTRSLQMAGALQRVSELCVQYSMEREQFGKPIGKQQILQHYLAQMAGDAAVSQAAADNAVDVLVVDGAGEQFHLAVAAAKTVSSRSVATTNKLAHQLHGAIGYTDEHRLQYWTRRLWAWRDEFGTETQWGAILGRALVSRGGEALWPLTTSWPPPSSPEVV